MTDTERFELQRPIHASAADIFRIVSDPAGHVAIDSTGMLQSYTGDPATKVGDEFVIHMDRESLNDFPLGKYDVTVQITTFEQDKEIAWTIVGQLEPPIGHIYGYRFDPGEDDGTTLVTRTTTGPRSTPSGGSATSSRSSPSSPSAPRSGSSSARSATACHPACAMNGPDEEDGAPGGDRRQAARRRSASTSRRGAASPPSGCAARTSCSAPWTPAASA